MVDVFFLLPFSCARPLRRELDRTDVIVPYCQDEIRTISVQ